MGVCKKCDEQSKYEWCKSCQLENLKIYITNETSKNERIDNLIYEMRLEIDELDDLIFEWISYNQLDNIKKLGEENFDKVYSAIWKDGPLNYNINKNKYTRNQNKKVALKYYNVDNIINEFFNEQGKKYSIKYIGEVLRIYGISQCPYTKDYIIVFQDIYCEKCGRKYTNMIDEWCESCKIDYFKNHLTSSGNEKIDNLIYEIQSRVNYNSSIVFEWIPFDQLNDIQKMNNDDFDIVYSAIWKDGPLYFHNREWTRKSNKMVNLKYLYNSQDSIKLLNKVKKDYLISPYRILPIYGISRNPNTGDYFIILPNVYCKRCGEPYEYMRNEVYEWCKQCQIHSLKQNFINWTSGNEKIDNLIQNLQLEINERADFIVEWIPYNQFNDIKEDDFNKEYLAIWKDGPLIYNKVKGKYLRSQQNESVILKFCNSQNPINEPLNEVKADIDKYYGQTFGISQTPCSKSYIIVLKKNEYNEICVKCNEKFIGGYSRLYSAIWKNGPLLHYKKKWTRVSNKKVSLKYLHDSQHAINELLDEVKIHSTCLDSLLYGISQDPNTKKYIMVFRHEINCEKCGVQYLKCNEMNDEWCKECQIKDLKKDFINWTSGNKKIDYLIQEMQLKIDRPDDIIFEWIPYNQFNNIKEIDKEDSATIYSAIWKNDKLLYYKRKSNLRVTLKCSQNIAMEVKRYSIKRRRHEIVDNVIFIYGITQNPDTKDYIMVLASEYCKKCGLKYTITDEKWCKLCQINYFKKNFISWTSGNAKIDSLIQEMQSKINKPDDVIFEWIPHNQFRNIIEIDRGGFSKIYSAIWKDGPIRYNLEEYERLNNVTVALKYLHRSQNISDEFLNEIKGYSNKFYPGDYILSIIGLSQDPDTKDYIMVLDYAAGGNFHCVVNNNYNKLDWSYNIMILSNIIKGLKKIHQNNMVHRDFHTGNILLIPRFLSPYTDYMLSISDMGLCGEVATGRQPFANRAHDGILALDICNGIRPKINEQGAPECYVDLMKRCWDVNPDNRPKATEVEELIDLFHKSCRTDSEIEKEELHYDIQKQFKKADEYKDSNFIILEEKRNSSTHPQAVYTSRLLNPFTEDLPKYDYNTDCLDCEIAYTEQ
ncbi:kinase-like domain-containing protein [Rhizophagus clarus]|uniref:Kinase-like domain-containing protein n=1 Tax=Rhizophagus clarus TaxID=94130 RepID=A0A8H3QVZ8_9GLOM|nr:kinase-like domain-containing protein [Rhizophagus clarus]